MGSDAQKLKLSGPVYTVANSAQVRKGGLKAATAGEFRDPAVGRYLPIFSTLELAKGFMRDFKTPKHLGIVAIVEADDLKKIAIDFENAGCNHAGIDFRLEDGKNAGEFVAMRAIIAGFHSRDRRN